MCSEEGKRNWLEPYRHLYTDHAALVLISVPPLLTIYRYYGSSEFFISCLSRHIDCGAFEPLCSSLYPFLCALLLLLIVPAALIRCLLKLNLEAVGLCWGNRRSGIKVIAILLPIIAVIFLYPASKMESFRQVYPLFNPAGEELSLLILYEVLYGCYYFAWEFFFRGYLLFILKDRFGDMNSILIQTIPSVLMHIGKPPGEIFASFVAGIAFGVIALKTRSVLYVFMLHWLIGITLDLLIVCG